MNINQKAALMIRILMRDLRISDKIIYPHDKGEQPFASGPLLEELEAAAKAEPSDPLRSTRANIVADMLKAETFAAAAAKTTGGGVMSDEEIEREGNRWFVLGEPTPEAEPKQYAPTHYVLCRGTSSMVKVADYFEDQRKDYLSKALSLEAEEREANPWFKSWKPVYVEVGDDPGKGIEAARELAAHMTPIDKVWKALEPHLPDLTALCPECERYKACRGNWRHPLA